MILALCYRLEIPADPILTRTIASAPELMEIALLADRTDAIDTVTRWYEEEWAPYYGEDGHGDARADLVSRCNRDRLPIGLVALEGTHICGTAALDRDVATGLSPSIVGLLVARDHRNKGAASALLVGAERLAQNLGYDEVFLSTSILGAALARRGWRERGEIDFLNGERGRVYLRQLTANKSR